MAISSWRHVAFAALVALATACAQRHRPGGQKPQPPGAPPAGPGVSAGMPGGATTAPAELDRLLATAALGEGLGPGTGAYMDRQEDKLRRIPGTTIERLDETTLLLRFDSDQLFALGSTDLSSQWLTSLDQAAQVLLDQPRTAILAQGHTDATGGEAYNLELSERRAEAVTSYLVERGIDATRIAPMGCGEAHPVADNATPGGRQRNRRVDLLVKAKAR